MDEMIKVSMYFGAAISNPDRDNVSDDMFAEFLRNYVDPIFDGYTVTVGAGSWKGKAEKVRILMVMMPQTQWMFEGRVLGIPYVIDYMIEQYKKLFEQESVMLEVQPAIVRF